MNNLRSFLYDLTPIKNKLFSVRSSLQSRENINLSQDLALKVVSRSQQYWCQWIFRSISTYRFSYCIFDWRCLKKA